MVQTNTGDALKQDHFGHCCRHPTGPFRTRSCDYEEVETHHKGKSSRLGAQRKIFASSEVGTDWTRTAGRHVL